MVILDTVRVLAQFTGAAFGGACLYIALVQQPARIALGPSAALTDFRATIPRAERLQAPLLIACLVAVAVRVVAAFSWPMLVGGVLMLAVLAQTVATVLPINRTLLSGSAEDHADAAPLALVRWGRLHAVRTVVAVLGAVALLIPR